jgi:hypothetical protein
MAAAREQVMQRSALLCEIRGPGCTDLATDAHHRQTRRLGPDCPCNLLAVCAHCHHVNVHGQPATARDQGWIVSRHAFDGSGVPVQIHGLGLVLLTCTGEYVALDGRAVMPLAHGAAAMP